MAKAQAAAAAEHATMLCAIQCPASGKTVHEVYHVVDRKTGADHLDVRDLTKKGATILRATLQDVFAGRTILPMPVQAGLFDKLLGAVSEIEAANTRANEAREQAESLQAATTTAQSEAREAKREQAKLAKRVYELEVVHEGRDPKDKPKGFSKEDELIEEIYRIRDEIRAKKVKRG